MDATGFEQWMTRYKAGHTTQEEDASAFEFVSQDSNAAQRLTSEFGVPMADRSVTSVYPDEAELFDYIENGDASPHAEEIEHLIEVDPTYAETVSELRAIKFAVAGRQERPFRPSSPQRRVWSFDFNLWPLALVATGAAAALLVLTVLRRPEPTSPSVAQVTPPRVAKDLKGVSPDTVVKSSEKPGPGGKTEVTPAERKSVTPPHDKKTTPPVERDTNTVASASERPSVSASFAKLANVASLFATFLSKGGNDLSVESLGSPVGTCVADVAPTFSWIGKESRPLELHIVNLDDASDSHTFQIAAGSTSIKTSQSLRRGASYSWYLSIDDERVITDKRGWLGRFKVLSGDDYETYQGLSKSDLLTYGLALVEIGMLEEAHVALSRAPESSERSEALARLEKIRKAGVGQ